MGICTSKHSSPSSPNLSPRNHVSAKSDDNGNSAVPVKDGGKPQSTDVNVNGGKSGGGDDENGEDLSKELENVKKSPFFPFYSPSPAHYFFSKKSSPARSPAPGNASAKSTPRRFFRRPFPPPSPAKHIKAVLARRHGTVKPNELAIPEGSEVEGMGLDKSFGFSKNFGSKYEVGDEVGKGHFGYTCKATFKKGELKGQEVAVKIIPKVKVCEFSIPI